METLWGPFLMLQALKCGYVINESCRVAVNLYSVSANEQMFLSL